MHKCTILLTLVALGASLVLASEDLDPQGSSEFQQELGDHGEVNDVPEDIQAELDPYGLSHFPEMPSYDMEIRGLLKETNVLFDEFCRNTSIEFYKSLIDQRPSSIFNFLFNSLATFNFNEIDTKLEDVENAARKYVPLLDGSQYYPDVANRTTVKYAIARDVAGLSPDEENEIARRQWALLRMLDALFRVVDYAAEGDVSRPPGDVLKRIGSVCESIEYAKDSISAKFGSLIERLRNPGSYIDPKVLEKVNLKNVNLENIGCLTTSYVFAFNKWCKFVADVTPSVMILSKGREE